METALIVLAAVLAIVGLVGSVVPVLPGASLNYAALLILHFFVPGADFGALTLIVLGLFTGLAVLLDYVLPMVGARMYGVSKAGLWGSFIGMVVGLVFFSFIGLIVGMFLGAVAGEKISGKDVSGSFKSGGAVFMGSVLAFFLKFSLSAVMTVMFARKLL